ncbi:MAG: SdrD B-like domain-containing protein [Saprospiraceae bacterium]
MKNNFVRLLSIIIISSFSLISAYSQVSGTVFRDFNGNGVQNNTTDFNEVGLAGVVVNATNASGNALTVSYTGGGSSTNSTGNYSVTGGTLGQIRLEFVLPDNSYFATSGNGGGTTIMFPTTATQNLAVNYPAEYSDSDPRLVTPTYVNGDNQVSGSTSATASAIYSYNFDASGQTNIGNQGQTGAVWGTAYHKKSDKLFYAAFGKRHVNWGPLGPNGLYVTTSAKSASGTGNTTSFVDLHSVNSAFDAGSPVRDFDPGNGDKTQGNYDENMILGAGTTGMGDLDVSDDGQYLYTVNLNDRKVWRIEVGPNGTAPTSASQIVAYTALPNPCTNSTFRPFAIKYYKGDIYVGGVCDGVVDLTDTNSSINRNNLSATVYKTSASSTPSSATWTEVFTMPLTFDRQANLNAGEGLTASSPDYIDPNGSNSSLSCDSWHPWARSFNDFNDQYSSYYDKHALYYPQPMLTDIEMDIDGSMILGFCDRMGHQAGNFNLGLGAYSGNVYYTTATGDILRVYNNNGIYQLESNGTARRSYYWSAGNGDGPGGGEFYFEDRFDLNKGTYPMYADYDLANHDETSCGGLTLLAGSDQVLTTVFDPRDSYDSGGTRWYSNSDGTAQNSIKLYVSSDVSLFGKANGVGDVELLVSPAPLEIGNRVWNDTNSNGLQDAGEAGISGVVVQLYDATGTTLIASATTDANGNYIFSSDPDGTSTSAFKYNLSQLQPNTSYKIVVPTISGTLNLTTANAGTKDNIDSDASSSGQVTVLASDIPYSGANNHTFDIGYSPVSCSLTDAGKTNEACNDNGTPSDPSDDYITFSLNPTGTGLGTDYTVSVSGGATLSQTSGTYGNATNFQLQNGSADGTSYTITITDNATGTCTITTTVQQNSCSDACLLTDAGKSNEACNDNGTPSDPSDDYITFSLNPTGTGLGTDYTVSVSGGATISQTSGTYGNATNFQLQNGSANGTLYTITITDSDDPTCQITTTVQMNPCAVECTLADLGKANETCNDNNTKGVTTDDYITFSMNPVGNNLGTGYTVTVSGGATITPASATYGSSTIFQLQNGSANGTTYTITVTDNANATCTATTTVSQNNCSVCGINGTVVPDCNDNNTLAIDTDDYITAVVTGSSSTPGSSNKYLIIYNGNTLNTGGTTYGSPFTIGTNKAFNANGASTYTIIIRDYDDQTCYITKTFGPVESCSSCPVPDCLNVQMKKN